MPSHLLQVIGKPKVKGSYLPGGTSSLRPVLRVQAITNQNDSEVGKE